jgi:hypothetical protein
LVGQAQHPRIDRQFFSFASSTDERKDSPACRTGPSFL